MHLGAWLIGIFSAVAGLSHDYYLSVARMEYDEKSEDLELSVWFFADDIAMALGQMSGEEVDWQSTRTEHSDSLLQVYLSKNLCLLDGNGDTVSFSWVGSKADGELRYAFLRYHTQEPEQYQILFVSLCEHFRSQRNLLHYRYDGKRRTFYFSRGDKAQPLQP
mgnify:CR=1 FL=1